MNPATLWGGGRRGVLAEGSRGNWGPVASLPANLTWEKLSVILHPEQKQKELGSSFAAQPAGYSFCVYICYFFPSVFFQGFSLSLIFYSFTMIYLGVGLGSFILFGVL